MSIRMTPKFALPLLLTFASSVAGAVCVPVIGTARLLPDAACTIRTVAQRRPGAVSSASQEERREVKDAIRRVADTGTVAILLVEQYYDFARDLADHYLLMERGEFIMRGMGADMDKDGVREALAV